MKKANKKIARKSTPKTKGKARAKAKTAAPSFTPEVTEKLTQLATLKGVQTSYQSAFGTQVDAGPESLLAILNALGPATSATQLDAVAKKESDQRWRELAEPVAVFWEGKPAEIKLRGELEEEAELQAVLALENGETISVFAGWESLPEIARAQSGPKIWVERALRFDQEIPFGYHELLVQLGKRKQKVLIISSPQKAYAGEGDVDAHCGVFAPLYALHTRDSWGIGDFSDLERFLDWSYQLGCNFVGTLPMLSLFVDQPMVEPSPYSPMSRLFWNELYLDPRRAPEWEKCQKAQKLAASAPFQKQVKKLQAAKQVDYQAVARLKRKVVELLAGEFFAGKGEKRPEFREFLQLYPLAQDYAAFRAVCDKRKTVWRKWPERMRDGKLRPGDYRAEDQRYHLYCQFLAHLQLAALSARAKEKGRGVYIDFPLSAHADGYDVWRERESFGAGVSAGCPPDPAHVHGQDWGILPLNPRAIRETGYRYFRQCLESHMRYAGMLRLDHVMCFFRLYWVPHGLGAKHGVYVRYQMEEFFALLVLESHRHQCVLIGEDLGTVPPEIRAAMTEHGILRMYVQQRRLAANPEDPFGEVPPNCICSINTHDMPPFSAFWQGLDILDKMKLKYFGRKELPAKQQAREDVKAALVRYLESKGRLAPGAGLPEVLRALLLLTADWPVQVMQVNLEDLWLETLPQNVPGTWKERPNWRRKAKYGIDRLGELKDLAPLFAQIVARRNRSCEAGSA